MNKKSFFLVWMGINLAGWATWIIFATSLSLAQPSNTLSAIGFIIIGGGMGFLQWLFLRQQFPIIWYEWAIATTIGFGLGLYALVWAALRDYYIVFSSPGTPILEWDPLLGGALLGLALGCCQALIWRPRFERMFMWVLANVAGWSLGMFLPQLMVFLLQDIVPTRSSPLFSTLFPAAFAAAVMGIVLVWFLGRQHDLAKQT